MTDRPLSGCVVGITADRRWSEQADLFRRRGAEVVHGPSIATCLLGGEDALRGATLDLIERPPQYLAATTGLGIRTWMDAARRWDLLDPLVAALADTRIVARGPKSANAVQAAGIKVWRSAANEQVNELIAILVGQPLAGLRVAVQLYGMPSPDLIKALEVAGADVVEVSVYQWRIPDDPGPALALVRAAIAGHLHAVTFTAAPAIDNLFAMTAAEGLDEPLRAAFNDGSVIAACVGPVCAQGATRAGIREPLVPAVGRLGLLVRALCDRLGPAGAATGG